MEYLVAGAVAIGVIAFDEEVKYMCKSYLKKASKKDIK